MILETMVRAPSLPLGAERVGVRWGVFRSPHSHLTLPIAEAMGPFPLPPEGRRGR